MQTVVSMHPDSPAVDAQRGVLRRRLQQTVKGLPVEVEAQLILPDLEGFTYPEIGRILGIPDGPPPHERRSPASGGTESRAGCRVS